MSERARDGDRRGSREARITGEALAARGRRGQRHPERDVGAEVTLLDETYLRDEAKVTDGKALRRGGRSRAAHRDAVALREDERNRDADL